MADAARNSSISLVPGADESGSFIGELPGPHSWLTLEACQDHTPMHVIPRPLLRGRSRSHVLGAKGAPLKLFCLDLRLMGLIGNEPGALKS